jgi:hypothetical protein
LGSHDAARLFSAASLANFGTEVQSVRKERGLLSHLPVFVFGPADPDVRLLFEGLSENGVGQDIWRERQVVWPQYKQIINQPIRQTAPGDELKHVEVLQFTNSILHGAFSLKKISRMCATPPQSALSAFRKFRREVQPNLAAILDVLSDHPVNFSPFEHFCLQLFHPKLYTRANPDRRFDITEAATRKDIKYMLLCRWRAGRRMKDAKKRKKSKICSRVLH